MQHSNEKSPLGTAGITVGETRQGGDFSPILSQAARAVNPQNDPVVKHLELAAWHRERAARWLLYIDRSAWHAAQYFRCIDAAAEHERLAADHARRRGEMEATR